MELEEMKTLWAEMTTAVKKQKKLTDSIIIKMARTNYTNKLNKIKVPETISTFVAFAAALLIIINFQKLNTWYLAVSGAAAALILLVLPILSLQSIKKMQSVNIAGSNYKQALEKYAKGKLQFVSVQKSSFYLGAVLMLVVLPVEMKLIDGRDIFKGSALWFSYVIGYPFYYLFFKWVFRKYTGIINDAENILKELEN